MPLTVAQLQAALYLRRGVLVARIWPAAVDAASAAPYLADPIAYGARQAGYAVATPFSPQDSDLAAVAVSDTDQVADVAELRLLETLVGNWSEADETAGTDRQDWGKFLALLQAQLAMKAADCKSQYGQGLQSLSGGAIDLGIAATDDAATLLTIFN